MDAVIVGGGAAVVIGLLYWFSAWWDKREWQKRSDRKAAPADPKPHGETETTTPLPLPLRIRPTWPLVVIVALIAGAGGAVTSRWLGGDSSTTIAERVQRLEDRMADVVDKLERKIRYQ